MDRLCEKGYKKMRVGFVGLGNLGKAIVDRMISQGINLYVYNRTIEKAKNYNHYKDPNELFRNSEVIFLIIKDSNAVKEFLSKIEPENIKNRIIVDMTTNSYQFILSIYNEIKELNGYYLEAPLVGSIPAAQTGSLVMLISGDYNIYKKIEDIIKTFTRKIYYFEEIGKPTKIKLLNNFALAGISQTISETVALSQNLGVEKELMIDILLNGAGRCYFLEIKKDKLLNEDFSPQFSVELLYKDLRYFFELINRSHLYSYILEPELKILERTINSGYGNLDISAIYLVLKEKIFNDERFIKGLKLLDQGDYFEAHEILEELWREIPVENRYKNLIKGFIQIAAGYYKYLEQRSKEGAKKIFQNAKNYLIDYLDEHLAFNVNEIVKNIDKILEMIEKEEDIKNFKVLKIIK